MNRRTSMRDVVRMVIDDRQPSYVPWSFKFTQEARAKLQNHFAGRDLEDVLQNHTLGLGNDYGFFTDIGRDRVRDVFGVVWDRSEDKDIGNVEGCVLPEPTLAGYTFPDPHDRRFFDDIESRLARYPDRFRVFQIGFSLFERAWTLRGMENLVMDLVENPSFVHELLNEIADYEISQLDKACEHDIDAVYFGDDWGQQRGLIMGPLMWHRIIEPVLNRMYGALHARVKYVLIHSFGDVDELFDDLIRMGVNCFNPFQPEVMDVAALHRQYRGRLTFHGGLSTQRTLPYGSVDDVCAETDRLIEVGQAGSYILSPAHSVEGDVPRENMLAFIECAQGQEIAGGV